MKKTMFFLLASCLLWGASHVSAQVSINTTGNPPHSSAMLDVTSDDKGILIPRMTLSDRTAITNLTEGLMIFQTDQDKGFYYYNGVSWTRLSTQVPLWTKEGHYLSPVGYIGTNLKIADSTGCITGFFAQMNTDENPGYGGYFHHTNSSNEGAGIYAQADYTGTANWSYTYGGRIRSNSTTQDQYGLWVESRHSGSSGFLIGMNNYVKLEGPNTQILYGIYSSSDRSLDDNLNIGISSTANNGTVVTGILGRAESGNVNIGTYGEACGGTTSYGINGKGGSWGGYFENFISNIKVGLSGENHAMQIQDGNEAEGKVLTSDASGNASWQALPAAVTPGGSSGYVQFNNAGAFGGTSELFWDNTNKRLGIGYSSPSARLEVDGDIKLRNVGNALMVASNDVLHTPANVYNICVGASSGPVVTGEHNAFFGFESGWSNVGGWDNTFIGYRSGRSTISGQNNTFIGSAAGYNNTEGSYNVFIGNQAGYSETGSQKLYVHNNNSSNPLIYGEFNNNLLKINGRLGIKTSPLAGAALHVDHNDLYAGYFSSDHGNDETHVIHAVYDGGTLYDAIAIYGKSAPADNQIYGIGGRFSGNWFGVWASSDPGSALGTAYAMYALCTGSAGSRIGVSAEVTGGEHRYGVLASAAAQSNSYGIFCNGNGVYTGTWSQFSDRRLKNNIEELQDALGIVMQLQPKSYEFRKDEFDFINLAGGRHYGFVAQQLEEVLPELVSTAAIPSSRDKNPEMFEYKTTNLIELIPLLTKAIQEQNQLIESQGRMIRELQREIEGLKNDQ